MAAGLGVLAAVEHFYRRDAVERYGPNFVAEIAGIVLTLIVVSWIVRRQRMRQLAPAQMVATHKLVAAFSGVIDLLAFMVKVSAARREEHPPATVPDLLERWLHDVVRLNFLIAATPERPDSKPMRPPEWKLTAPYFAADEVNWGAYLADELEEIDEALGNLVDTYSEALGASLFLAIERLRGDLVFSVLRRGVTETEGKAPHPDRDPFLALAAPESGPALLRFAAAVKQLAHELERTIGYGAGLRIEGTVWRTDVFPKWGSARYEGPMHARLTRNMVLGGGRLPRAGPERVGQVWAGRSPR